jgi:hypothetical protein
LRAAAHGPSLATRNPDLAERGWAATTGGTRRSDAVIEGVGQVIIDVEDQDRALEFWTNIVGFDLAQDAPYGEGQRWIEVTTPDKAVVLVLSLRRDCRPTAREELPTSNVFYCDDLSRSHKQLSARGIVFPQPPIGTAR